MAIAPLSHFLCKLLTSTLLCNVFVNTVWVVIPFSRDLPDSGIEPGPPALQTEPPEMAL